jgi:5'-3' exonuclease
MGIPSYFSYIVKNHINIIKPFYSDTIQINNFYLDCNSIIYDCVHNIDFTKLIEEEHTLTIIQNVCHKIEEYISILKPNNLIYIAFDGVAPVAKLDQQRSRRYKSVYQSNFIKKINNIKTLVWNTTAITPGTVFMNELNSYVKLYFAKITEPKIIISTSDYPGEGEHKIFEYIRNNSSLNDIKNSVVYGLDADLIMLAINHLPITNNIYLYRETPEYIKSIHIELEPNKSYIIDIPELAKIITLNMNNNIILNSIQTYNRIYDYIFLCFFLGNDFMPHFPAVNISTGGIDKLLNAYKATIGNTNEFLTDGKIIYWQNVYKLVLFLAKNEEDYIKTETKLRNKKEQYVLPNKTYEEKIKEFEAMPSYDRLIEKYINPFKLGWQERYYKILFYVEIDDIRREQICINYLEGLEWNMKYYTIGCPDWRWCYKYHYPPLLVDLVKYIPRFHLNEKDLITNQSANPVTELVQLCYVLPKQSLYLLPVKLHEQLLNNYSQWYNINCNFVWAYCRYFWESHVELPFISIKELEPFINTYERNLGF